MSTLITLACMSALAGFVYYYLPRDRPRKRFRLEQFRPAAPLAGILATEPDALTPTEEHSARTGTTERNQSSDPVLD